VTAAVLSALVMMNNNEFFFDAALRAARRSTSKHQVGCIIVKDNKIISMGYSGIMEGKEGQTCQSAHAEANAIAAVSPTLLEGATLYLNSTNQSSAIFPCRRCMQLILAAKIRKFMIPDRSETSDSTATRRQLNTKRWSISHS
jgi:dCMP deaminase